MKEIELLNKVAITLIDVESYLRNHHIGKIEMELLNDTIEVLIDVKQQIDNWEIIHDVIVQ